MTDRHTVDTITSDALDHLYDERDRLLADIALDRAQQWPQRLARSEAALARVRTLAARIRQGAPWTANDDDIADHILAAVAGPGGEETDTTQPEPVCSPGAAETEPNNPGQAATDAEPDDLTGVWLPDPPTGRLTPVIEPAEHCGDQLPAMIGSSITECVLRPGHSGSHADRNGARWFNAAPEPAPAGLREQIAAAMIRVLAPDRHLITPEEFRLIDELTPAVLAVILPNTRITASIARDAEATVQRVIDLYERWVKAGAPPLGTSMARWWDRRLAELHAALEPPKDQP